MGYGLSVKDSKVGVASMPFTELGSVYCKAIMELFEMFLGCTIRWLHQLCDTLWGSICVANEMVLKLAGKIRSHKSKGGSYLAHILHMSVACGQMNLLLPWAQLMHHACAKGMEPTLREQSPLSVGLVDNQT